jgi:outer membrane immunogenic protein
MKKLLLGSVGLLAVLSNTAIAADMPVKAAPPPPPAAADQWNGFYLGINGGFAAASNPITEQTELPGLVAPVFAAAAYTHAPTGGLFGTQAGANWHAMPSWVLGAEADWQWLGQSESICTYACLPAGCRRPARYGTSLAARHGRASIIR